MSVNTDDGNNVLHPPEAAFELGRSIVRFDWHSRLSVFTWKRKSKLEADKSLVTIERCHAVLFPQKQSRSVSAFKQGLADALGFLNSMEADEAASSAWDDACHSEECASAAAIAERELSPLLPAAWPELWDSLTRDLKADYLIELAALGRCLERGICPPLKAKDVFQLCANPAWLNWKQLRQRRRGSGTVEPASVVARRKLLKPGQLDPGSGWLEELQEHLRLLELPSVNLIFKERMSRRDRRSRIEELVSSIKKGLPKPEVPQIPKWVCSHGWHVNLTTREFAIHGVVHSGITSLRSLELLKVLAEENRPMSSVAICEKVPRLSDQSETERSKAVGRAEPTKPFRRLKDLLNSELAHCLKNKRLTLIKKHKGPNQTWLWVLKVPPPTTTK